MILGMSTATFTQLHVLISLLAIGSGMVVVWGFWNAKSLARWTAFFLATTALTSLTGFLFPFKGVTPGIVVGVLSIILLAVAVAARYSLHMRGAWRPIYVITAMVALYFNVFVLAVQSFEKVPALRALAPTQKEPPFAIVQLILLVLFVGATVFAVKRFRPDSAVASSNAPRTIQKRVA